MKNGDFPMKNGDFPINSMVDLSIVMLVYQRVMDTHTVDDCEILHQLIDGLSHYL